MPNAAIIAMPKIHQFIVILYGKSFNQLFIAHQPIGNAIREATRTSATKFRESNPTMWNALAPNTFLMLISFVLCSALNAD